jgi:hypothetical protein
MEIIINLVHRTNLSFEAVLLQIGMKQRHAYGIFAKAAGSDTRLPHGFMHVGTRQETFVLDLRYGKAGKNELFVTEPA